jgi:tRNA A37 N6-isopentenylltransferase MiaA
MLERFRMTRKEFEEEARQYLHALPANCVPELLGEEHMSELKRQGAEEFANALHEHYTLARMCDALSRNRLSRRKYNRLRNTFFRTWCGIDHRPVDLVLCGVVVPVPPA